MSKSLLLHKLHHNGIRSKTNKWITYRTEVVVVEGEKYDKVKVEAGEQQGSV